MKGIPRMSLHRLPRTGSTQDEARALIAAGHEAPFAVATEDQRAGRGRLDRTWVMPPGSGLALTAVHRPSVPPARRTWYPLVTALAVRRAVQAIGGELSGEGPEGGAPSGSADPAAGGAPTIGCKWPNDLHDAAGRKLAGILLEAAPTGELLIGAGVNLRGPVRDADGSPLPSAVALDELAGPLPPEAAEHLAERLWAEIEHELVLLDGADGDALGSGQAARYRESCITLGRHVRVEGVGGGLLEGRAVEVDPRGRLLVRTAEATVAVDVGDVHHVRAVG